MTVDSQIGDPRRDNIQETDKGKVVFNRRLRASTIALQIVSNIQRRAPHSPLHDLELICRRRALVPDILGKRT